jgi:RimJ/RimL family protein N-acetyltransferase
VRDVLEPVTPEHEPQMREAAADGQIWRWTWPEVDWDEWFAHALRMLERGEEAPFATLDAESGRVIGSTRYLTLRRRDRGVEIGWTWLAPSAWRTGANVEAKLLMLAHAFDDLGCLRVEFKTHASNERSRTALAALPAQLEGVHRKHMVVPGLGVRDSAYYSIVDDEWPDVRANLERRLKTNAAA